jgi:outer membrane usher protein
MHWPGAGTTIDLGTWRRDHDAVHALRDALHARRTGAAPAHPVRARIEASLRQSLGNGRQALRLAYVERRFRAQAPARSIQLGASMPAGLDGAALHALFERSHDRGRWTSSQATLALSLPLTTGAARTAPFAHAHARAGPDGHALQSGIGGAFGPTSHSAWRIGITHANGRDAAVSSANASVSHLGRAGRIDAGVGSTARARQWSLSGEGALVLHPHGATFGAALGDTMALVRAEHGAGARLLHASHVALDRRGRALSPPLSPYRRNRVGIDPGGASPDVAFAWTERDVVPRAGAIVDVPLPTTHATTRWLRILDADGLPARFGARIVDAAGGTRGLVGRDGHAHLQGEAGDALQLLWMDAGAAVRCTLASIEDTNDAIADIRCIDASRDGD